MYQNIRTIRVGTFNLMNFMLPNRPVYGGSLSYTSDEFRRKADWVKFMLNEIDADIVGFQELFHKDALIKVVKDSPKYRKARVYIAEETGDQPSVALLSRYPVENLEVFTHFPENAIIDFHPKNRDRIILPFTTFTRPVLKADIRIPQYGLITIFVVHLKSKREIFYADEDAQNPIDLARAQSRSLMLRASESVALRTLVAEALETPDRPVILCGDVNDTGNAVTSRIISGEVPQHRLCDKVKRRQWDLLLYHVKDIQARRSYQDFYYTHIHNGMYESLDHIMVSQELVTEYPRNTGRVGLVSVYNDHLVDQTFTTQGQDKCKSDHGVVVCSIELDLDRAAKYIYSEYTDDDACDEQYENALDRQGNDRFDNNVEVKQNDISKNTPKFDKAASDARPAQQVAASESASETPIEEGFNLQNSLDRWKRNHPEQNSTPSQHRHRLFSQDKNDRNKRRGTFTKHELSPEPPRKPMFTSDGHRSVDKPERVNHQTMQANAEEANVRMPVHKADARMPERQEMASKATDTMAQQPVTPAATQETAPKQPPQAAMTETVSSEDNRQLTRRIRHPRGPIVKNSALPTTDERRDIAEESIRECASPTPQTEPVKTPDPVKDEKSVIQAASPAFTSEPAEEHPNRQQRIRHPRGPVVRHADRREPQAISPVIQKAPEQEARNPEQESMHVRTERASQDEKIARARRRRPSDSGKVTPDAIPNPELEAKADSSDKPETPSRPRRTPRKKTISAEPGNNAGAEQPKTAGEQQPPAEKATGRRRISKTSKPEDESRD